MENAIAWGLKKLWIKAGKAEKAGGNAQRSTSNERDRAQRPRLQEIDCGRLQEFLNYAFGLFRGNSEIAECEGSLACV